MADECHYLHVDALNSSLTTPGQKDGDDVLLSDHGKVEVRAAIEMECALMVVVIEG